MMSTEDWLKTDPGNFAAQQSGLRYWLRTSMGLENLVLEEIKVHFDLSHDFISHRNLFIQADLDSSEAILKIRTADDVYAYLGYCDKIDHTRSSAERLSQYFKTAIRPYLLRQYPQGNIRITVSFVGKRNFNRYFIENQLNDFLATSGQYTLLSNEQGDSWTAGEIRIRVHLEDDRAFFGVGLLDIPLHRRPWRTIRYTGQLHTPVAACMARQLTPSPLQVIIDPFCGSGTLLIESALIRPDIKHVGYDLNEEAIEVAKQTSTLANAPVFLEQRDSLSMTLPDTDYLLLSNPPWGEKHEIGGQNKEFYQQLARLIRGSSGAMLLLPEELLANLREESGFKLEEVAQTRIRGKLAFLVKIEVFKGDSAN